MSESSKNLFAGVLKPAVATPASETPVAAVAVSQPAVPPVVDPDGNEPSNEAPAAAPTISRLEMLKNRANLMGIKFSNNIGEDALAAKIKAKMEGEAEVQETQEQPPVDNEHVEAGSTQFTEAEVKANTIAPTPAPAKPMSLRQSLYKSEMRLLRLRITNMDPKKKDLPGEIFTFGNRILGTVRKYIPYGEATENGYHVPYCIYKQLRDRKFLQIKVRKVNGREVVETSYVREFALEIMDQLTKDELHQLATAQIAAGSVE